MTFISESLLIFGVKLNEKQYIKYFISPVPSPVATLEIVVHVNAWIIIVLYCIQHYNICYSVKLEISFTSGISIFWLVQLILL